MQDMQCYKLIVLTLCTKWISIIKMDVIPNVDFGDSSDPTVTASVL